MTKERALKEAQKIANTKKIVMVVVNDPISNNMEDEPDGPWGYCPYNARHTTGPLRGKLILYPWTEEEVIVNPES